LLTALILAGCGVQEVRERPDWDDISVPTVEVTDPEGLPVLCPIEVYRVGTAKFGTWSDLCWKDFEAYEIVAEGNTDIATYNANSLRNTEAGYNQLINAGKMEQELSAFYLEQYKAEKKEHFWDNVTNKIMVILGVIAGASL
jgi:hypothetical protein